MEYRVRFRFGCSGFAFHMKPRICILCSFVIENLDIFCQPFIRAIRPAVAASQILSQIFAACMRRFLSKCFFKARG